MREKVLEVVGLKTHFFTRRGVVKAVDDVSFFINEGETLALVGESASGKSVTCLSIVRLLPKPAGRIVGGKVLLDGQNLLEKTEREMRTYRGSKIAMIVQDPMTSLNPVLTIGNQVEEAIRTHQGLKNIGLSKAVTQILSLVRIPSPEARLREYPHQMSGGMRQRVVGAIALSCKPKLLIADEPTTSLDVTIQAQYLALLKDIQQEYGMGLLFVTHDLGIVAGMADKVAVMYAGKIVESAPVRELLEKPVHPYTIALLNCVPKLGARNEILSCIEGQPPSLLQIEEGCSFAPRCAIRTEECLIAAPPQVAVNDSHVARCWKLVATSE